VFSCGVQVSGGLPPLVGPVRRLPLGLPPLSVGLSPRGWTPRWLGGSSVRSRSWPVPVGPCCLVPLSPRRPVLPASAGLPPPGRLSGTGRPPRWRSLPSAGCSPGLSGGRWSVARLPLSRWPVPGPWSGQGSSVPLGGVAVAVGGTPLRPWRRVTPGGRSRAATSIGTVGSVSCSGGRTASTAASSTRTSATSRRSASEWSQRRRPVPTDLRTVRRGDCMPLTVRRWDDTTARVTGRLWITGRAVDNSGDLVRGRG
jgi:hypothetical protein